MKEKKDPMKAEGKLSALKKLRDTMSGMMQDDLGGKMNKVTVASPDKEGLNKGLDKAKELLGGAEGSPEEEGAETPEIEKQEDMMSHATEGSPEEEASETTEQEIDEMMAKLAEMKKRLKG